MMAMVMARFKIGTRVFAGFGLILLALVFVSFEGWSELGKAELSFSRYADISGNTVRNQGIESDVNALRRNVLIYANSGDEKALARIRDLAKTLRDEMKASFESTAHPERKENLRKMQGIFEAYAKNFDHAVELRHKRDELVNERMNPIGAKARTNLTEIIKTAMADKDYEAAAMAGVAQENLMLARLNAVRFLANNDPKLIETAIGQIEKFQKDMNTLVNRLHNPTRLKLAQETEALSKDYLGAFKDASAAVLERNTLINKTMAEEATHFAELIETTMVSQKKSLAEILTASEKEIQFGQTSALTISAISIALGILFAWLIASGITKPVNGMTNAMTKLANGDKTTSIPSTENKDELGSMAKAVLVFKENMIKAEELAAQQEELKRQAEIEKRQAINDMADNFEKSVMGIVNSVSSSATELQASAQSLSSVAEQTQRQSTAVSAASEQASTNVQTVASAAEELASSIKEIGRQVEQSSKVSGGAVAEAQKVNTMVEGLAQAANKIGEVVNLINDIASQTNLLALNATIEAARAGDAGKGFAVVASEVKNLANQTAKATEEIASQITSVQDATKESVTAIKGITATITQISEISAAIASAVEEQGAATGEISRNVQQAAAGTQEVTSNISGVLQASTETGHASSQVLEAATGLSEQAEHLKEDVNRFIAHLRAA